jgi:hypothetical protein
MHRLSCRASGALRTAQMRLWRDDFVPQAAQLLGEGRIFKLSKASQGVGCNTLYYKTRFV